MKDKTRKRLLAELRAEAVANQPDPVNCCAASPPPQPEPAIYRSEPMRLVDIGIFKYGIIRQQAWPHDGGVRSVTLDEVSARQLMHDLLRTLL